MQTATRVKGRSTFVPLDVKDKEIHVSQATCTETDKLNRLGDFNYPVDLSVDPDLMERSPLSHEQIWDNFCKKLGQHYGLADIRDAR